MSYTKASTSQIGDVLRAGVLFLAAACVARWSLAQTQPTSQFDTGLASQAIAISGSPADANVAVSHTHVCLTARGALACYTKAGTLVTLGPGLGAAPTTAENLFSVLSAGAITVGPIFSGTPTKDGRIVFDPKRKRFLMAFQTRDEHPKLLIAASKSENPQDGWWTFGDNVEAGSSPIFSYQGQDYMWMGLNANSLMVSNNMHNCSGGSYPNWTCTFVRTRHLIYPLDALTAGTGSPSITREEWFDDQAGTNAVPCVDDSSSTDAFWIRREDDTHVTIWGRRNGQTTNRQVIVKNAKKPSDGQELNGGPVKFDNVSYAPTNAERRGDRIVFASNVGHHWANVGTYNAIQLVRVNVKHFFDPVPFATVELDRIFGRSSAGDAPGLVYHYGWPAVSTNPKGDIVVGSVRTNAGMWPEFRASVWFAGQSDIGGSVALRPSEGPLPSYHMAGAAADPSTSAVYVAQQFGKPGGGFQPSHGNCTSRSRKPSRPGSTTSGRY